MRRRTISALTGFLVLAAACAGNGDDPGSGSRGGRGGPDGSRGGFGSGGFGDGPGAPAAAVPVEVVPVTLRGISSFIETNGVLEAENEVDVVSRTVGPIVELLVEEGEIVRAGQLMARIDDRDLRAQMEVSRVDLNESTLAFERAESLREAELLSAEVYEQTRARFEAARAQFEGTRLQLSHTQVSAPFDGLVADRYVKFAQHVSNGAPLFRLTDFDPLLCKIQVPERDLSRLSPGQPARVEVEAWREDRFTARVLRVSPVVAAETGTIRVTLEVRGAGKLRPGMFARVFVETASHDDVRVVPRAALTLDSIGDTLFVADGDVARRRDVRLGFREGAFVEILEGVEVGEQVVVVGQDGLSDGTPIQVLVAEGRAEGGAAPPRRTEGAEPPGFAARAGGGGPPPGADAAASDAPAPGNPPGEGRGPRSKRDFDPAKMTPEQLERAREFMRARGMTEEQIAERLGNVAKPRKDEDR